MIVRSIYIPGLEMEPLYRIQYRAIDPLQGPCDHDSEVWTERKHLMTLLRVCASRLQKCVPGRTFSACSGYRGRLVTAGTHGGGSQDLSLWDAIEVKQPRRPDPGLINEGRL